MIEFIPSVNLTAHHPTSMEPAAKKPKMVEDVAATGERELAARRRLAAAGYEIPSGTPLSTVHCEKERFGWLGCGFLQVYANVDGVRCRILDYAPGQALQPHTHDADEQFLIRGGRIKVWSSVLSPPQSLSIPSPPHTPHLTTHPAHTTPSHPSAGFQVGF